VAALDHAGQYELREVHETHEIDLEHRVDRLGVLLLEQSAGHEAGVVHEQVDRRQLAGGRLDRLAAGEVHAHGTHLARAAGRRVERREALRVAGAAEQQAERPFGQLLRHGAADAAVRAGHERGLSLEVHRG